MFQALKAMIQAYQPGPGEQPNLPDRFIDLLTTRSDCFYRTCFEPGHITASAWVVSSDLNQALLLRHRKLNAWFQPGGHCDGSADVLSVALREVAEETGLVDVEPLYLGIFDLDIHDIPAIGNEPAHAHFDVRFLVRCKNASSLSQNHESTALAWFSKDKNSLPTQDRSVLRLMDKWQAYCASAQLAVF